MTFIIAIQLNDSIIVTADNKKVVLRETGEIDFKTDKTSKIYAWDNGIITGTGESHVISRSIALFKKFAYLMTRNLFFTCYLLLLLCPFHGISM